MFVFWARRFVLILFVFFCLTHGFVVRAIRFVLKIAIVFCSANGFVLRVVANTGAGVLVW